MKVSKALEEVWRWKEEVYQEIKDAPVSERIAYFKRAGERLEDKTGIKISLHRAARRRS